MRVTPQVSRCRGTGRMPPTSSYRPPPARHWRSYGDTPLPTAAEALNEPSHRLSILVRFGEG